MARITLKGNPINTSGDLPKVGATAPAFSLVAADLSEKGLKDFPDKTAVINIVPSFDTAVCAASVRKFNERVGELGDTVVLNVSMDLPFAQKRFCEAEGLQHVTSLSAFRSADFGRSFGMTILDGPLKGLLGRAVVVVDPSGKVIHTQLVPEIAQEPDYDAALSACSTSR
jgi:thioredoxin-dependent peroxiredoxin